MNKTIKKLKSGGFEVVSTSYDLPVRYEFDRVQSRLERRGDTNNSSRHSSKHSIHRDNSTR